MKRTCFVTLALGLVAATACDPAGGGDPEPPQTSAAAPVRVDSVLPREEEMRRFTAGLAGRPEKLTGGEGSIEALSRALLAAVAEGDSAALRRMHLSRAEFAYLYYEHTPVSKPPYDLPPGLMWLQIERGTEVGLGSTLRDLRGTRARFQGVRCGAPRPQGPNTLHPGCAVRYAGPDGEVRERVLFGPVLERGGHFKFVSYAVPD
jgi:hypothetical protein